MARVNVYRFSEEEFVDNDGAGEERCSVEFGGARLIARADSVDTATRLLGISGLRALDRKKHPVITSRLKAACKYFGLPGEPVEFLRGTHGTFAITRVSSPKPKSAAEAMPYTGPTGAGAGADTSVNASNGTIGNTYTSPVYGS